MPAFDFTSLPLTDQRAIDQLCVEFEDRWLSEPQPDLQAIVERSPQALKEPLLGELLKIDASYRRRRGQAVSLQNYLELFPDSIDTIHAAMGRPTTAERTVSLVEGYVVGRYRILKQIGAGQFGEVFLARDECLGRDVAIKTLRPDQDDELLMEEARTAARIHHPNIASIFDTGRLDDDRPFVVMEYVDGKSLRECLTHDPLRFSPADAAELVANVADAVESAHRQGIVHRDLSPENIMIDVNGAPKVTDFGLALQDLRQSERVGETAGTPAYMSPEQLRGESQHLDGRTDVWALGVVLYELLCGRRPFAGDSTTQVAEAVLHRPPPPLRREGARITGRMEQACLSCLVKDVGQRCASAAELAVALRRQSAWRRTAGMLAAIAVATAIFLGVAAWLGGARQSQQTEFALMINAGGVISPLSATRPQLKEGDEVFLEVRAAIPSYFHVWWIDSQGHVQRVTSRKRSATGPSPPRQVPMAPLARQCRLPPDPGMAWPLPPQPGGRDTVLVLASQSPDAPDLPREVLLAMPDMIKPLPAPAWFFNGQRTNAAHRAGPQATTRRIDDALGRWHQRIAKFYADHGDIRAVTFSCEASASVVDGPTENAETNRLP